MTEEISFGIVDYCVFSFMLIISGIIGFYISYKGNKTPEEFLIGNRSLHPLPVSMSLLSTCVSAISLLGFSGEAYAYGIQLFMMVVGAMLAIYFVSNLILPILFPLKLTTVNEYILLRFKSEKLTIFISIIMMIKTLAQSGIVLYAPTLVLASITKLSVIANILLLGIICTAYSAFGGIKAVIWTDVFQLSVMMIGLVSMIAVGCVQNGGIIETLSIASKGGRLDLFNMSPSPFVGITFFNATLYGFINYLRVIGIEQSSLQRVVAVKSFKKARNVLKYNIWGFFVIFFLIFGGGVVAYARYAGCDPMALGIIKKKDEILSYFVMDKLSLIPGLPGIFVSTIIGGLLSTISSQINSSVALIWKDVCLKFAFFKRASPMCATLTNKILSLIVGIIVIGLAIITSLNSKGLAQTIITFTGVFTGPFLGIFLIGFFLPKCNAKGVFTGFIISFVLTSWIAIGGMIYKKPTKMLPFSVDECDNLNFTLLDLNSGKNFLSSQNRSSIEEVSDNNFVMSLYQISNTLYASIGLILCVLIAVTVSCITGNQKIEDVSPDYVSSYVHQFYWTKEEIERIRKQVTNSDFDNKKREEFLSGQKNGEIIENIKI